MPAISTNQILAERFCLMSSSLEGLCTTVWTYFGKIISSNHLNFCFNFTPLERSAIITWLKYNVIFSSLSVSFSCFNLNKPFLLFTVCLCLCTFSWSSCFRRTESYRRVWTLSCMSLSKLTHDFYHFWIQVSYA